MGRLTYEASGIGGDGLVMVFSASDVNSPSFPKNWIHRNVVLLMIGNADIIDS